ncbi:MAG TPA: NADH-ubiquinone oxidoreductase-F iron-sulfur binding region domain-containing protein [Acidimicrobiia bacterium]|nr:NADH-ubiquinone oxidoreductase-F iron-sulfur binding region domain-containing protein [Acidimicrobiia bacterium]
MTDRRHLLGDDPFDDVDSWVAAGGGAGLGRAHEIGPAGVIGEIRSARLRGRGGAGFPTAVKWAGVAERQEGQSAYVVCNAAEGEPGTFKDRALIRSNPFQLLEGIAVAAFAVGAEVAYLGIKASYDFEIRRLEQAAAAMDARGILGEADIRIVTGPDDYLLGEEKALLEVIEGRDPLPRQLPPYLMGLHAGTAAGVGSGSVGWDTTFNPTVVNNVETLSHVPHILARGADWFRSVGTEDAPGTMVFTVSGDVRREAVVELPLGTPLSVLVHGVGEGPASGDVGFVFSGAANGPVPPQHLDVPMDFGSMRSVGSGLGSGGMIVGDDTACVVASTQRLTEFLAIESCGQCPPCKLGTAGISDGLAALVPGGDQSQLDDIVGWLGRVTDANRCGLGAGSRDLVDGLLRSFPDHVAEHLGGGCDRERVVPLAKFVDHLPEAGRFVRDDGYFGRRTR